MEVVDEGVAEQGSGEPKLLLQPHALERFAHVRGTDDVVDGLDPGALDTAENVRGPVRRAEQGKLVAALVGQHADPHLGVLELEGGNVEHVLGSRAGSARRAMCGGQGYLPYGP